TPTSPSPSKRPCCRTADASSSCRWWRGFRRRISCGAWPRRSEPAAPARASRRRPRNAGPAAPAKGTRRRLPLLLLRAPRAAPRTEGAMIERKLRRLLDAFAGKRVLVLGDVILDEYLLGEVKRISPEAPVPVVEIQRRTHVPGGAANAAANVAALGGVVY